MRYVRNAGTGLLFTLAGTACGSSFTDPIVPRVESDKVYWRLTINYRAINLALAPPHNGVKLHVIPRNVQGEEIGGWQPDAVHWTVPDLAKLQVDSTGLLTAVGTGNNIRVIATLQIGDVTHSDTAFVKVTATAPVSPLKSLSIQPPSGRYDISEFDNTTIRPVVKNEANGNVTALQIAYSSSDLNIIKVANSGITNVTVEASDRGEAKLVAETYAYGVYATDTATCRVVLANLRLISVFLETDGRLVAYPDSVLLATGGLVLWSDQESRWTRQTPAPGVAFEFPDKAFSCPQCEGLFQPPGEQGDIPSRILPLIPFSYSYLGGREFREPGVYPFYIGPDRVKGKIVVVNP